MMSRNCLCQQMQKVPAGIMLQCFEKTGRIRIVRRRSSFFEQPLEPGFQQCLLLQGQLDAKLPIHDTGISQEYRLLHQYLPNPSS